MKVLHLISGGDSGGAKTHVMTLLNALKDTIDVKIVCLTDEVFYQQIKHTDIPNELFLQKNRFDLSVVKKLEDLIKKEGFEILHSHGARANFVSWMLKKRLRNFPMLTSVHSDYLLDFTTGIYKKFLFTALNKHALKCFDYYIAISDSFKNMLISRNFKPNKIFTVYNGIEFKLPSNIKEKDAYLKSKNITVHDDDVLVGIVGRFDQVKGHDVFLKGAKIVQKSFKNVHFLLAGEGDELSNLQNLVKTLHLKNVHFIGFEKDIHQFYNAIDINCLTSYSESFPYAILEGAIHKKMTVASKVGGIKHIIKDNKTGFLFEAADEKEFAEKLKIAINDKELREKLGENLYKIAEENFSDQSMAKTHIEIYNSILKREQKGRKHIDIMLLGYYGFDNSGDEALLKTITDGFLKEDRDIQLLILSKDKNEVEKAFQIDSINRFNFFKILECLTRTKLLIYGGGSLIQDVTSSKSLYYYLSILYLAKKLHVKVMLYGSGIGPINKKIDRILSGKILNLADTITLRENESLKELENLKVVRPQILLTGDPVIGLQTDEESDEFALSIIPKNKYFCVSLRPFKNTNKEFIQNMVTLIDTVSSRYALTPILIPMQAGVDNVLCDTIHQKLHVKGIVLNGKMNAQMLMSIISKSEFLIGMRLHSLIYAANANIPSIGIIYDPKVLGFLKYLDVDLYLEFFRFDINVALKKVETVILNREEIKQKVAEKMNLLRENELQNIEKAMELLDK